MNKTNEKQGNNTGKEIKRVIKSIIDKEMKFYRNEKKEKTMNDNELNSTMEELLQKHSAEEIQKSLLHSIHSKNTENIFDTVEDANQIIKKEVSYLLGTLLSKNTTYNNSVFNPYSLLIDSNNPEILCLTRIQDKLYRIFNDKVYDNDNDYLDIAGYFVLYHIIKNYKDYRNYKERNKDNKIPKRLNLKEVIIKLQDVYRALEDLDYSEDECFVAFNQEKFNSVGLKYITNIETIEMLGEKAIVTLSSAY